MIATSATAKNRVSRVNRNSRSGSKNGHNGKNGNGHGKAGGNGKQPNSHGHRLSSAEIELKLQAWEKQKADAKSRYEIADRLESEIVAAIGVGGSLTLSDGRTATIANNFIDASGNPKVKHFGLAGVRQFELKLK